MLINPNIIVIVMEFHMEICLLVIIHFVKGNGFIMNVLGLRNHREEGGIVRIVRCIEGWVYLIRRKRIKIGRIMLGEIKLK